MDSTAKHVLTTAVALLIGAAAAGALFVWSGAYNIGADDKHTAPVAALLETLRDRSVQAHASGVNVPDLADTQRIVQGAGNYAAMCVGCHLAPGLEPTELTRGLYPTPPKLAEERIAPAEAFWVIKHGIKATGMPAWGKSMADDDVWNLAAFLQRLLTLDAQQYRQMVASSGGHSHGGGESGGHLGHGSEGHHEKTEPTDQAHHKAPSRATGDSKEHADEGQAHHGNAESSNSSSGIKPASKLEHPDDGHKH